LSFKEVKKLDSLEGHYVSFKGRHPVLHEHVDVYRNLHTTGFSIRDSKTKQVLCHADYVSLEHCTFHVGEKSRQKVVQDKERSIHAYVKGTLKSLLPLAELHGDIIYYNPYQTATFVCNTLPIKQADAVYLQGKFAYLQHHNSPQLQSLFS
jgi:hypothetical protein